jgi:hypothetical protein
MWTSGKAKQAMIKPRPLRVAYLVPPSASHELLDALFDESMSRWGGRRTPIIPCGGADLTGDCWNLLEVWDADIIYSYVDLAEAFHNRLAHRLAPGQLIRHRDEAGYFRPNFQTNASLLESVSVLALLAKQRALRAQAVQDLLDKERYVNTPRDLDDSFGFVSNYLTDIDLLPYARRLSIRVPARERYAPRFSSAEQIEYVEGLPELENIIRDRTGWLCMSQMSDMFAPFISELVRRRTSWDEHLSIIVGDEVSDRLFYWNAIHRYQSLTGPGNFQLLRLSPSRFGNELPAWISRLCSGQRNRRHFSGNAAPRTIARSCSADPEFLARIAEQIRGAGMNMASAEQQSESDIFEAFRAYEPRNRRAQGPVNFISGWQNPVGRVEAPVRFAERQFELPLVFPFHLKEMPMGPTNRGAWAVDLTVQRDEDHSRYDNRPHRWMFPRRLRMESAVRIKSYGESAITVPPRPRPTEEGDFCLWDGLGWQRPLISMPNDLGAFIEAVEKHHPETTEINRPTEGIGIVDRFSRVEISDKGRDLLGILQLFRSLPEALLFLNNPYWRARIERLCPTEPEDSPRRVAELARELQRTFEQYAGNIDYARISRRVMRRTAEWIHADNRSNAFVSYHEFLSAIPSAPNRNALRSELGQSVTYLRNRGFLRQGYGWDCSVCQYPNWVALENALPRLHCEICRVEHSWPVCGNTNNHFRLNPFVASAFSSSSAQEVVLAGLNRLANKASWSFMFGPALDVYKIGENRRFTDIDILAAVDGEVYLLEAKRSFAGFNHRETEKLVELAAILKPDFAGFVVASPRSECMLEQETQQAIEDQLANEDVRFLLWASDDHYDRGFPCDIPRSYGRTMQWSAW